MKKGVQSEKQAHHPKCKEYYRRAWISGWNRHQWRIKAKWRPWQRINVHRFL